MIKQKESWKGILLAVISSSTFGLIPLFSLPLIAGNLQSPSILFYRFLFSTILMGAVVYFRNRTFKLELKSFFKILGIGIFYGMTSLLLLESYFYIPSGTATTIHFLYPVLVGLLMTWLFKEKFSVSLFLSTLLSIIGVAVLSLSGNSSLNFTGVVFALASILTYSLYIIGVQKIKIKDVDEYLFTFIVLFSSTIFFSIYSLLNGGVQPITTSSHLSNLILLALLPTLISDLTLVLAIKKIGPVTTSILGSMEPVTALLIGVLIFNEVFSFQSFLGVFLILTAVIIVILKNKFDYFLESKLITVKLKH